MVMRGITRSDGRKGGGVDLIDLKTFEAVARSGGITRAARELHTVQSNVTARVLHLERELGVSLFHRHGRGVTPTVAGRELLPYAEKIRGLLEEARRAVGGDAEPSGTLRIGSLETTAAVRLPPILTAFTAACPRVTLILRTGTSGTLIEEVLEYRLDGALVAGPVGHPELVEEAVIEEELVVVTPAGCRNPWKAWAEAGEARLLVFRTGCTYRQRLELLLAGRGITNLHWLEFGTLEGIIGCVGAGLGSTFLPRAVVEPARREGRVALHRLAAGQGRVKTVFLRRRDTQPGGSLARFLECSRVAGQRKKGRKASQKALESR